MHSGNSGCTSAASERPVCSTEALLQTVAVAPRARGTLNNRRHVPAARHPPLASYICVQGWAAEWFMSETPQTPTAVGSMVLGIVLIKKGIELVSPPASCL